MESRNRPRQRSPWRVATKTLTRRAARPFAIVCIVAVTLTLIVLSPLALKALATERNIDWTQLSNIGQAYGAISAILSALALVAVSASIGIQAKEGLVNRRHIQREFHMRLTTMAMSDPLYMQHWVPRANERPHDENRQLQFANQMVSLWYMYWELGDMPSETLSIIARDLFTTSKGREFWVTFRDDWAAESIGSRLDHFHQIIDDAFNEALESNHPTRYMRTTQAEESSKSRARDAANMAAAMSVAFAGGFIVRKTLQRRGLK
jgi:hypothetical protein